MLPNIITGHLVIPHLIVNGYDTKLAIKEHNLDAKSALKFEAQSITSVGFTTAKLIRSFDSATIFFSVLPAYS
ncbi:hypothetical protein ACEPAF_3384 [Sanghuangporus sanghuang]